MDLGTENHHCYRHTKKETVRHCVPLDKNICTYYSLGNRIEPETAIASGQYKGQRRVEPCHEYATSEMQTVSNSINQIT